jgi:hypothetical protein
MPDEEAFSVLVTLMKEYGFRDLYSPKLTGLQLRLYQFDEVLILIRSFEVVERILSLDCKTPGPIGHQAKHVCIPVVSNSVRVSVST